MSAHLISQVLEGLADLAENSPDNPRLARNLLLIGCVLIFTIFAPTASAEWGIVLLIVKSLCVITGGVCSILGAFIFFRRWVWTRQDRRTPVITTLKLK